MWWSIVWCSSLRRKAVSRKRSRQPLRLPTAAYSCSCSTRTTSRWEVSARFHPVRLAALRKGSTSSRSRSAALSTGIPWMSCSRAISPSMLLMAHAPIAWASAAGKRSTPTWSSLIRACRSTKGPWRRSSRAITIRRSCVRCCFTMASILIRPGRTYRRRCRRNSSTARRARRSASTM